MRYYEVTMSGVFTVPRAALLLAGVAAGAMSRFLKPADEKQIRQLRKSIADLEGRLANQEARYDVRFSQLEAKVVEHEQRLSDVPSTSQIVAAMETLLSKTMTSLDARLSAQAHSIDVLKTTVSQTDELLERVLESIDKLGPPDTAGEHQYANAGTFGR
jgi:septal ring factor EnvC (AmiA/AmiB activator)